MISKCNFRSYPHLKIKLSTFMRKIAEKFGIKPVKLSKEDEIEGALRFLLVERKYKVSSVEFLLKKIVKKHGLTDDRGVKCKK